MSSATASPRATVPPKGSPPPEGSAPPHAPPPATRITTAAGAVAVRVPAIGVDSELVRLGLNPDGSLEVPQPGADYDKAGWFTGSPAPDEVGPAVIEGHIDSAANGPSVFFELGAIQPGDRVDVDRADGSTAHFTVRKVASYPKNDFPTLEVYGNTAGPELRWITCGADFDSTRGGYRNNTVVYARLNSRPGAARTAGCVLRTGRTSRPVLPASFSLVRPQIAAP